MYTVYCAELKFWTFQGIPCLSTSSFLNFYFFVFFSQMLMTQLSPEEYILATINLYLDIVNLFIYILRILEAARRS